jgi:hypothetical protein
VVKRFLLSAVLAVGFVLPTAWIAAAQPPGKIVLCHVTGSESNPIEFIEVSEKARPAHVAHGDSSLVLVDDDGNPIGCVFVDAG